MATKNTAVSADQIAEAAAEPTAQQLVNAGIMKVVATTGIDVQKNRYKAMRAIAWQAFSNAIEAGTFDKLVADAIKNVNGLPAGWEIEVPVKRVSKASPAKATTKRGRAAA